MNKVRRIVALILCILVVAILNASSYAEVNSVDCYEEEMSGADLQEGLDDTESISVACSHVGLLELKNVSTYGTPKVVAFISHAKTATFIPCSHSMYWTLEWDVCAPDGKKVAGGKRDDGGAGLSVGNTVREVFTSNLIAFDCYLNCSLTTTVNGVSEKSEVVSIKITRGEG